MTTTHEKTQNAMRLYNRSNRRLYLNASERTRFLAVAKTAPLHIEAFALVLFYSGCRLSEVLELTPASLQIEERLIAVRSLKKRNQHHIREVPVPGMLILTLQNLFSGREVDERPLWDVDRMTAYRWIKSLMKEARIMGPQACPKGLRHGYGIYAIQSGVQINMLRKWVGHSSIETTAIFTNAVGA